MRYRLICFDAAYTLVTHHKAMMDSLAVTFASEGRTPSDEELRRAWDAANRWFLQVHRRPVNTEWTSDARIRTTWRQYHQHMLRELSIKDQGYDVIDTVINSYFEPENWQLYPDVRGTLQALEDQQVTIGIISDWESSLPMVLDALEISKYIHFTLTSASVGFAKPSPELFQLALDRAGVAPHEALMVGDSYPADVLGARSVGMDVLMLDREHIATAEDVPIIHALDEVLAFVAGG